MSLWTLRRAGARNECLDCTVMVLFCADKVGLQKKTQKEWDLLEAIIQPAQNDLFALPVEPPVDGDPAPDDLPLPTKQLRQPRLFIPE
jgi:hypothetical protein